MGVHRATLDARSVALALGGVVESPTQVTAPGPNHKPGDRSMSVFLDPEAPEGFRVHSSSNNDPMECRDYVRERLGLPRWEPKAKSERNGSPRQSPRIEAEYVYKLEDGTPYLKVIRYVPGPNGNKDFRQQRWNGSSWEWGKPKGPKVGLLPVPWTAG